MGKQLASISKIIFGLIFLSVFCLYLFRQPLLDVLLDSQLTNLGIPMHSFRVEDVSLHKLVLRDISLGTSDEMRTDKINVTWTLRELLQGELDSVEINGLQLSLDLSGEKPPLGSLQKLLEDTGDESADKRIPNVSLLDAQVDLLTPYGNVTVDLEGSLKQGGSDAVLINLKFDATAAQGRTEGNLDATLDKDGNLQGALTLLEGALTLPYLNIAGFNASGSFSLVDKQLREMAAELAFSDIGLPVSGQQKPVFEQANINLQMDAASARITGDLLTVGKVPAFSFDARSRDHLQQANIKVDLNADVPAELPVWGIFGLPQPGAGSASFSLHATGKLPAQCVANDNWRDCLLHSVLNSTGNFSLDGLSYAQKVSELNGHIAFNSKLEKSNGNITFKEDSELKVSGLDIDWLKSLGFPAEQTSFIEQDTQLHLRTNGNNSASIRLGNSAEGTKLRLKTALMLSSDTAQASIQANAEALMNQQNQLASFTITDLEATTSGIDYSGNTLDHLLLSGSLQGSPESFAGDLDLSAKAKRLRFDLLDARQAKVILPLQLNFNDHAWAFSLRKQGQVSLGKLAPIETVRIAGPLTFRLPKAVLELTPNANGLAFRHEVTVRPDDFTLLVNRSEAPAIEASVKPVKIVLKGELEAAGSYSGKSSLRVAEIGLPQYKIQLDNIASTIYLGEENSGTQADFNIGKVR